MSQPKCSCASFPHLEGASVPAYIKAFLEPETEDAAPYKEVFRCRVCGSLWERLTPDRESARPSLVRLKEGSD